jgi:hypothetical protein
MDNPTALQEFNYGGPAAAWLFYLPAHSWNDWGLAAEPTCTEAGYYSRTCSCCGEKITDIKTGAKALGHNWGATETVSNDCVHGLKTKKTCKRCAETETNITPGRGYHDEGTWHIIKESTCRFPGFKVLCCNYCDANLAQEDLPLSTEHQWRDPEYTGNYYLQKRCKECGKIQAIGYEVTLRDTLLGYILEGETKTFTYELSAVELTPTEVTATNASTSFGGVYY